MNYSLDMRSKRVDSSVLLSVGYDEKRRVLKVRFRNGRVYYYLVVPPAEYRALLKAPSTGKYLHEVIKPKYQVVRGTAGLAKTG